MPNKAAKNVTVQVQEKSAPKTRRRRRRNRKKAGKVPPIAEGQGFEGEIANVVADKPVLTGRETFRQAKTKILRSNEQRFRDFVISHIDPNGEFEIVSENCKVPDGALPNSGFLQFREVLTLRHPDLRNGSILPPSETNFQGLAETWTLTFITTPFLRRPLIIVANRTRSEMSDQDKRDFVFWWNHEVDTRDPLYPEWIDLNDDCSVTVVRWSALEALGDNINNDLISSFRICHKGMTIYNNTPDLVNQGTIVGTQNQANWEPKAEETAAAEIPSVSFPHTWTSTNNTLRFSLPGFAHATIESLIWDLRVAQNISRTYDYKTAWSATPNNPNPIEVDRGNEIRWSWVPGAQNVYLGTYTIEATVGDVEVVLYRYTLQNTANSTVNIYVDLSVIDQIDTMVNAVVMPPFGQQNIIQSSPKSVMFLAKTTNGSYQVQRIFQPIFNVQTSTNFAPVKFTYPEIPKEDLGSALNGPRDIVDRNFGFGVQVWSGIPTACAPLIKLRMGFEFVASERSLWSPFMYENKDPIESAIATAKCFSTHHPFLYLSSYNDLGGLLGLIQNALAKVPILGDIAQVAIPIVSGILGSPRGTAPHSANVMNQRALTSTHKGAGIQGQRGLENTLMRALQQLQLQ